MVSLRGAWDLAVVAAQDGRLDEKERAALETVPMDPDAARFRDAFLEAVGPDGAALNPEVEAWRRVDPDFDARVSALRQHAAAGDLILWKSDQSAFPWNLMKGSYGPWQHVSVVLADGNLLDPYWPDGVTVSTVESAVAKSSRRIKASEMVIVRPAGSLSLESLKALTGRAYELQGRGYALLAPEGEEGAAMSCARAAWEVFKAGGVDLVPASDRMYPILVSPGDFARNPVARILRDGSVDLTDSHDLSTDRPGTALARFLSGGSRVALRFPFLLRGMALIQEPVIHWLMDRMAAGAPPLTGTGALAAAGGTGGPLAGEPWVASARM